MSQRRGRWSMTMDASDKSSYARSNSEPPIGMLTNIMNGPFITWFYKKWHFADIAGPVTSKELLDMYNQQILTDTSTCWRADIYAPKTVYKLSDIVIKT